MLLWEAFLLLWEYVQKSTSTCKTLYSSNGAYAFLKSVGGCISFYKTASHGMIARYVSPMILAIAKVVEYGD